MKKKEKSDFFIKVEKRHNVEIGLGVREDKVYQVRFDFPAEVWADLSNKHGKLLGMCCGNISTMRDCFMDAMREDGWMDCNTMQNLVVNMANHNWAEDHPASKVEAVYEDLLSHLDLNNVYSANLDDARDVCFSISMSDVWKFCAEYSSRSMFGSWGEEVRHRIKHNADLYEILPAVRTLYHKLAEIKFPSTEAYGIVRKANNQIYEYRNGELAVFDKKADAEKKLKDWIATEQVQEIDAEVRALRASLENGIEFIEEVENPFVLPEPEITPDCHDNLFKKLNELRKKNEEKWKNDKVEVILRETIGKLQELRSTR